jgi:DsbC/DsbD-like thiol-disulfide interchange protein
VNEKSFWTINFKFTEKNAEYLQGFHLPAAGLRGGGSRGGHHTDDIPAKRPCPDPLPGGENDRIDGLLSIELASGWKTHWRSPAEGGVAP